MKNIEQIYHLFDLLKKSTQEMVEPAGETIIAEYGREPFLVLASCLLSLRTKDTVSLPASRRLFSLAKSPYEMVQLSKEVIEKAIYPVGFYRQKAMQLQKISQILIDTWHGVVPHDEASLLSLPGVGRKTMNLVRALGFAIPAICVDVHVHRIANRLGLVATKTPEETEAALRKILPQDLWIACNRLFVMWGQNICTPQSPYCSRCPLFELCTRRGVTKSR